MHPLDDLFDAIPPNYPAVVYGLSTAVLAGWLAVAADPVPFVALAVGALLSVGLSLAYEHTGLQRESVDGERSTADRVALGVFVLLIAGVVIVGELDAISLGVSAIQAVGVVAGLLAGASVMEWLLLTGRARVE